MEIVKQNMDLIELNMEVFFVEGERVEEFNEMMIESENKEDSFIAA